jgi:hypothetical protein
MSPKVYEQQHLGNGNGGFVINGPTGDWAADEMAAVITFVVKQNGNGAVAVGIGESVVYNRPENGMSFDWTAHVKHVAGPAFRTGDAKVQAWASIAERGGPDMYPWGVDITINP